MPMQHYINGKEKEEVFIKPIIIHWVGYMKPWSHVNLPYSNIFFQYLSISPFRSEIRQIFLQRAIKESFYNSELQLKQSLDKLTTQIVGGIDVLNQQVFQLEEKINKLERKIDSSKRFSCIKNWKSQ